MVAFGIVYNMGPRSRAYGLEMEGTSILIWCAPFLKNKLMILLCLIIIGKHEI